ncbi:TetR/AcrR family transcriptional regulator [Gordonia rhizosphera]|uniref:Putative TetR family transcriptional regulator n=1 Tax=Gordonia rhizosphera NBRC 16068 TaxID=1108045 RepID=K6VSZ3_9ACTN|nr:TetR/AcrR family transcriptional regulator [Gordonia rhizosphera]GAB90030.1 putative TetR family transcriptional regulator [Gordonia rhizosphera NBRC 16068]
MCHRHPRPDASAQRVARTEAQLIDSARALFLEKGYVATTLAEVARRAGLAPRTVYVRFATKATLFRRVVDRALVGDAEPIDVAHRARTKDAMSAPTLAARIEALADVSVGIASRAGTLFGVAAQAEGLEPELAETFQAGRRATAELCQTLCDTAATDGLMSARLDPVQLATVTDLLICADTTVSLRRTQNWSASTYRALIIDTLDALTRQQARSRA